MIVGFRRANDNMQVKDAGADWNSKTEHYICLLDAQMVKWKNLKFGHSNNSLPTEEKLEVCLRLSLVAHASDSAYADAMEHVDLFLRGVKEPGRIYLFSGGSVLIKN